MSNPSEMSGEPLAGNPLEEPVDSASTVSQTPSPIPVPVVARPESHETPEPAPSVHRIYRHKLPVRLAHWLNVLCLPILIMSGLQIFNAHPALYWGERSDRDRPLFALRAVTSSTGALRGVTRIGGAAIETAGVLGASRDGDGRLEERGFPRWATLPGTQWLAMGRRWHLFFAWIFVLTGAAFALYAIVSRHAARDLVPWPRDLRGIGRAVVDHLRFRHPSGAAAARYNVLQKIAYTAIIFGLAPLAVLSGLAMSPTVDAAV